LNKLTKSLRFAHAAEIAAYHAYEGHWRSVSNQAEREYIRSIALDELEHIHIIEDMLRALRSGPSPFLDRMGLIIGEIIGILCYHTGWRLPMYVAGAMEKIGTRSYREIALEAAEQGRYPMVGCLMEMAKVEEEHEEYFEQLRKAK
jgi:rubrerythrin